MPPPGRAWRPEGRRDRSGAARGRRHPCRPVLSATLYRRAALREVESLVGADLEPATALAAATWRGGELLGEPDAGRLREGGPADLVLVHGDPLSDPAALRRVWHVGWLDGPA